MVRTFVIVSTHTTRHLRRTLLGLSRQSLRPDLIVVTCDTDDAEIRAVIARATDELGLEVLLVQRPFQGASRSSQVRNNGVRALLGRGAAPGDRLVFLDGDGCPAVDALAQHARLGARNQRAVVIGFRIDLTPEQTDGFDEDRLMRAEPPVTPTPEQLAALRRRHRRYVRHAILRRLRLAKTHKPKLLSANFSLPLSLYREVNGFDEEYEGYGQEDDDLGRRLYLGGGRPVIGVAQAVVFHQYHPTRAPQAWERSPNAARFARRFEARCKHGLESPAQQPAPTVIVMESRASAPDKQAEAPQRRPESADQAAQAV